MSLDEETLERVALDGEMDYSKWPSIIEPLMERVNHIVYNDFPIPKPYANLSRPPAQPGADTSEQPQSQPDQANIPQTPSKPPVPLFGSSAASTSRVADSLPASQNEPTSSQHIEDLPQPLLQLLHGILSTLRSAFMQRPPHTIQRLAELVLNPTNHYKTLPAWLRAVDRVVNVSSTADIFPLPDQAPLANGVNGDTSTILVGASTGTVRNGYDSSSLGSDESLGGALLTPIPWLRNGTQSTDDMGDTLPNTASTEDSEFSNGSGENGHTAAIVVIGSSQDPLVPERPDGAVTQGELMRLEQEAGVVPVSANPTRPMPGHDDALEEVDEEGDPIPHARGPELVGAVDMGKVEGKNVQVSLDRQQAHEADEMHNETTADSKPVVVDDIAASTTAGQASSVGSVGSPGEEDYEMVDKADEMDVDDNEKSTTVSPAPVPSTTATGAPPETGRISPSDADQDMVLVDAAADSDSDGTAPKET
ncbi:uncharacterized protein AB675_5908 [Cyphellophora attinorum]|uniref:Serine/threonine-protein phosphatase 4 regulatory subunit 2 n=1 Tax=Cyphellophora attinorum TaxID=1664694 RepID=A0A0N1H7N6_9EURO|nr:uncharacterized protein AB675_5908 [Phialophora attinorum]KPI38763.1 hypothetical protein AB675_5908 [Phialophora attinorum]